MVTDDLIQAGPHTLDFNEKTYIMGILNVTPDSFSDGGKFNHLSAAIDHAARLVEEGADILDIGGESTRPGSIPVGEEEELERVIPAIEAVSSRFPLPISVDTYKAEVAQQALQAGAHIINDVWGAQADARIAEVARDWEVPLILMHNQQHMNYEDLLTDICQKLKQSVHIATEAGVQKKQIILDPGIGFGKNTCHSLRVLRHLDEVVALGYPVLLGTSRKRFIGEILSLPATERVEGTIASVSVGVQKGCHIVRVHDVRETLRAVKVVDAMLGKRRFVAHG